MSFGNCAYYRVRFEPKQQITIERETLNESVRVNGRINRNVSTVVDESRGKGRVWLTVKRFSSFFTQFKTPRFENGKSFLPAIFCPDNLSLFHLAGRLVNRRFTARAIRTDTAPVN